MDIRCQQEYTRMNVTETCNVRGGPSFSRKLLMMSKHTVCSISFPGGRYPLGLCGMNAFYWPKPITSLDPYTISSVRQVQSPTTFNIISPFLQKPSEKRTSEPYTSAEPDQCRDSPLRHGWGMKRHSSMPFQPLGCLVPCG